MMLQHTTSSFLMTCFLFLMVTAWSGNHGALAMQAGAKRDKTASCRLAMLFPFTDTRKRPSSSSASNNNNSNKNDTVAGSVVYGNGNWPSSEALALSSISLVAAAEMARRHFNERNTSVVPQLAQLVATGCPVRLSDNSLYLDSGYSRHQTMQQLLPFQRRNTWTSSNDSNAIDIASSETAETTDATAEWCAIIGPMDGNAHRGLAVLTENWNIPQISFMTTDQDLGRYDRYPTFVRVTTSAADFGAAIADAIQRDLQWQRQYVAVLFNGPDFGDQYLHVLSARGQRLEFTTMAENIGVDGSSNKVQQALRRIQDAGFRTIFVAVNQYPMLQTIAQQAVDLDMVGRNGYLWLLVGDVLPHNMRERLNEPAGSPLDLLLDGSYLFTQVEHYQNQTKELFMSAWHNQDSNAEEAIKNVLERQPRNIDTDELFVTSLPSDYFGTEKPSMWAAFLYDAIILTGIAACKVFNVENHNTFSHVQAIRNVTFVGATGRVLFQNDMGGNPTRDPTTVTFGLHNIRSTVSAIDKSRRTFNATMVARYQNGTWLETGNIFYYAGGTTEEPKPLITVFNANFLSKGAQMTGLTLFAISLFVSLGSGLWVYWRRHDRPIQASQPEFLYLLCFGSFIVSVSILCVSFDEDKGWSTISLSRACAAFPWFLTFGHKLVYSSLSIKLWRLSQVMTMQRRRAISLRTVMLILGAVCLLLLVVLLTWQFKDPLQWMRSFEEDNPTVTYGECAMENSALAYAVPLGAAILFDMISTAVFSWKLREVQSELAESRWIFFAIFGHLQILILGIPVYVIADDTSRDVSYLVLSCAVFTVSTNMVACVIWPKIFAWYRETYCTNAPQNRPVHVNLTGKATTRITGIDETTTVREDGSKRATTAVISERPASGANATTD